MNIFKRIKAFAVNVLRGIRGKQAPGAKETKARIKELKKAGINNAAMKTFENQAKIFKKKYGKNIFSTFMTEEPREEAASIFASFMENRTSDLDEIVSMYEDVKDLPGIKDVEDIADMARQVDIAKNRERAAAIYAVYGSPVINEMWNDFKSENETKENVELMKEAINNVMGELEEVNPFTGKGSYMTSSKSDKMQMVKDEFERLKDEKL